MVPRLGRTLSMDSKCHCAIFKHTPAQIRAPKHPGRPVATDPSSHEPARSQVRSYYLGALFIVTRPSFTTTLQKIPTVKAAWLRKGHERVQGRPSPTREAEAHKSAAVLPEAVRATLSVSSTLRFEDHQIIRSLWCITCTHRAARNLAAMAQIPVPIPMPEWIRDEQEPAFVEINALRSLSGIHVYASIFRVQFCLRTPLATIPADTTEIDFPRVQLDSEDKACEQTWKLISALEEHPDSSTFLLDQDSALTGVPREPLPKAIAQVLSTSRRADGPDAFLLHIVDNKVNSSGHREEKWCLMVLKHGADFDAGSELAGLLREAANEAEAVVLEHKIDEYESWTATMDWYFPTLVDMEFIVDWEASLASHQKG